MDLCNAADSNPYRHSGLDPESIDNGTSITKDSGSVAGMTCLLDSGSVAGMTIVGFES
jgi:hypothetical protein